MHVDSSFDNNNIEFDWNTSILNIYGVFISQFYIYTCNSNAAKIKIGKESNTVIWGILITGHFLHFECVRKNYKGFY